MRAATAGGLFRTGPRRPLPRKVRPVHDETCASFLQRLAQHNRVPSDVLRTYLGLGRSLRLPELADLAMAAGLPAPTLSRALPELRSPLTSHYGNSAGWPNQTRPACRRCMASSGIFTEVPCWMRPDQSVCPRHQLWIGTGTTSMAEQLDLARLPEISQAQHRHRRIIRRHGRPAADEAFIEATDIVAAWNKNNAYDTDRRRRQETLYGPGRRAHHHLQPSGRYAADYPETVALTSLIASAYWRSLVMQGGSSVARFLCRSETPCPAGLPSPHLQARPRQPLGPSSRTPLTGKTASQSSSFETNGFA
ncbi:TniQ family protein [Nonomuraea sp. NPDC003707]